MRKTLDTTRHSAQGHGLSAQTYLTPHTIKAKQKGLKLSFQAFLPGGDKRDRTADLLNAIQALSPYKRVANPLKGGGESAFGTQKYLMTLDSQSPG